MDKQELILQSENKIMARTEVQQEVMSFQQLMEQAQFLSKSTIVPVMYQNRPENCLIAIEMATRMNVSPLMVMQNLYVVQGKPSWSGSAMASMVRSSTQFRNVELVFVGTEGTDNWGAYVQAERVANGKTVKGATVTIAIAKKEGWYQKAGSKWQSMPEQMLSYRAFAWFSRVHCPELTMGLQSTEEVSDVYGEIQSERQRAINPYDGK